MRDLYRQLGLDRPTDDLDDIQQRISMCTDRTAAAAARQILLDPSRKSVYDVDYRLLTTIGHIRRRLSLPTSKQWDALGNHDFDAPPSSVSLPSQAVPWETTPSARRSVKPKATRAKPTPKPRTKPKRKRKSIPGSDNRLAYGVMFGLLCMVLALVSLIVFYRRDDDPAVIVPPVVETPSERDTIATSEPGTTGREDEPPAEKELTRQQLPKNKTITQFTSKRGSVPCRINTREGGGHYYVTLVDTRTEERLLSVFIQDGKSVEFKVPEGEYELHYAAGRRWYGKEDLFGTGTARGKAGPYKFTRFGVQITGVEIELGRGAP